MGERPRDATSHEARLASQFIERNRAILKQLDVTAETRYEGASVDIAFHTQTTVGAVPLLSPTSGRADFGLIVRPRFRRAGLGPMLSQMGWRVIPQPLPLPLLPQSDRDTPPWVLSAVVLFRLDALLRQIERRFDMAQEERRAPRGAVRWGQYASVNLPRAQFLTVPCRFPDLRDDRTLRGAIRFTIAKQIGGLESQRAAGSHVTALLEFAVTLLEQVRDVAPREPSPRELDAWLRRPMRSESFVEGIQAIDWTANDRGLAGLSDVQGLPWSMQMDAFFEAWVETIMASVAPRIGGVLRTSRRRETVTPIAWEPPYLGSQKSLRPDVVIERHDLTVIIDAKYKEHWEEMQQVDWRDLEENLRERHRADLLQVLAYANLSATDRVVVCLAYPCTKRTWESLLSRNRLFHRASLSVAERRIDLRLTAMPMGVSAEQVTRTLVEELTRRDF